MVYTPFFMFVQEDVGRSYTINDFFDPSRLQYGMGGQEANWNKLFAYRTFPGFSSFSYINDISWV